VRENFGNFQILSIRRLPPPGSEESSPPVEWPEIKQKAQEDEEWKEVIDYFGLDERGFTDASEDALVDHGGYISQAQMIVPHATSREGERNQEAIKQHCITVATNAITELQTPAPAPQQENESQILS
jgi:hypothetical protein